MYCDFQTQTHAKWILAGEHAVIRGYGALVFPLDHFSLTLSYRKSFCPLEIHCEGEHATSIDELFLQVVEYGIALLGQQKQHCQGQFFLKNNIPLGVGLGASAALCVAVTRWFIAVGMLDTANLYPFAKQLEDLFHGQSSGLDIAGVIAETGIYFQQGAWTPLTQRWQPQWRLSSCDQVGLTKDSIQKTQAWSEDNQAFAELLDQRMHESVILARHALENITPQAEACLIEAMDQAASCFQQWGLISEDLHRHMQTLRDAGASAVKPTGSGNGGYVVSLWKRSQATQISA